MGQKISSHTFYNSISNEVSQFVLGYNVKYLNKDNTKIAKHFMKNLKLTDKSCSYIFNKYQKYQFKDPTKIIHLPIDNYTGDNIYFSWHDITQNTSRYIFRMTMTRTIKFNQFIYNNELNFMKIHLNATKIFIDEIEVQSEDINQYKECKQWLENTFSSLKILDEMLDKESSSDPRTVWILEGNED
jgi:hypothetical protein